MVRGESHLRCLRHGLIHLCSTLVLLGLLEGLAAWWLSRNPVPPAPPQQERVVAERQHTRYDELLGWVNIPNLVVSNMYGEGLNVTINNLGFRGRTTVDAEQPAGKRRIILSGDSFTFGYGVDDAHTWGNFLKNELPDTEVLKMALGGYGLGQAFLWYRREGDGLPHDVHLFAFITENFRRMTRPRFMGYGKPVLTVRNGKLAVENVPPPKPHQPKNPTAVSAALQRMHLARVIHELKRRYAREQADHWVGQAEETARLMFTELHAMHQKAGRLGALIYLPVENDYDDDDSDTWRAWLSEQAWTNGWIFFDLVAELRALPAGDVPGLFIQQNLQGYSGARGHYTETGNRWVAEAVLRHLAAHPELSARLELARL
jgi:hypothetical protein